MQVDVGIDPQEPFLHVAIGHAEIREQQLQLRQIGPGLFGAANVGG